MSPDEKAAYAVALALDEQQEKWIPRGGIEDLLLANYNDVTSIPHALFGIAEIAVKAVRAQGWRSAYEK